MASAGAVLVQSSQHNSSKVSSATRQGASRAGQKHIKASPGRDPSNCSLTFVRGTMLSSSFWSTRLAPASDR